MSELTSLLTVGITGPRGFIAGHLARYLKAALAPLPSQLGGDARPAPPSQWRALDGVETRVVTCSRETLQNAADLQRFVNSCDTIVHLAGMCRGNEREIYDYNTSLTDRLVEAVAASARRPHVVFLSSTQRDRTNAYGRSKKYAEDRLRDLASRTRSPVTILVTPEVYGPGCRPYHNSIVATFCHQLAHEQEPVVFGDEELELVWINDLVEAICQIIGERRAGVNEARVAGSAQVRSSHLLEKLQAIRDSHFAGNAVPDLSNSFDASLYTTFFSSLELSDHCRRAKLQSDSRGQLFEVMRLAGGGQIFFSTTKPGLIRGNHFHSRKVERFCVVSGEAVIRIRRVGQDQIREFRVSGKCPEFVSVPALCTHQIENVGDDDLLTMFWSNEIFEPGNPDTFFEKVA